MAVRWILASRSPRRVDLLTRRGLEFIVSPSGVEEWDGIERNPESLALRLARDKARAVARRHEGEAAVVLGADTVVVIGNRILGQPANKEEARRMLSLLSNRTHRVITGVVLHRCDSQEEAEGAVTSRVSMRAVPRPEIRSYVGGGECFGKAGAYAIQGRGAAFVTRVDGPYDNVIGLPVDLVARLAEELGLFFPSKEAEEINKEDRP